MGGAGGGRFARGATMLGCTAVLQMEVRSPLEADRPGGIGDGRWGCGASPIACKAAFAKAALRIEGSFRRANGSSPLPAAAAAAYSDGSGGRRFASLRACSLAFAAVSRHEVDSARQRACSLERAAMLCHEFCCLHSRERSLALAAVSRHEGSVLGPRFLGDPSSSDSPIEPIPESSSAENRRPFDDLPSLPHLPSLNPSPTFLAAFHCKRSWHHRQQRHRSRLGKSAAETISSIAHRSFGRPGVRKGAGLAHGLHAGYV